MIERFFLFFAAVGFSLIFTPLIRSFANWARILDFPSERKVHNKPVPLLGGIAIFLSFNITIILGIIINPSYLGESIWSRWQALLLCQTIILGLGFLDDMIRVQPGIKLLFQIFVGVLIFLFGFGINNITNPLNNTVSHLGIFSFPVTIFWLLLIVNALNLMDGLDGLAAGTSLIVSMTVFAICYFTQNNGVAFVSLILAGSLLGFLKYNFYPAKIFLGDSGSLLLGFLLAVFSIQGSSKGATLVAVLAPVLALGLPIMETLLSMIRRLMRSIHLIDYPTKNGNFWALYFRGFSIFKADKDHIHHRLLKLGYSQKQAVSVLYGICIGLSVLAFLSIAFNNINFVAFLGAIVIAVFIGIKSLKYQEFKILESGLLMPVFNFPVINSRLFHAFFDLAIVSFSFFLCLTLIFREFGGQEKILFIESLPLLLLIKIIVFYLSGIYKKSWAYSSLEELISLFSAVFLSVLISAVVFEAVFGIEAFGGLVFFVLDFYLLLTFAGGFRFSYRILTNYYKKSLSRKGKKALIYGAGYKGSTVLKEIRHNGDYPVYPVGYLDDDPAKRGKDMHGCPVLGSIDDLERILSDIDISEIIISSSKIAKNKINRLAELCRQRGIIVRQFEFRFYEFP